MLNLLNFRKYAHRTRPIESRAWRPRFERLEDRALLSVGGPGFGDLSAMGDEYSVDEAGNAYIVDPPLDPQRLAAETSATVIEEVPAPLEDTFLLHSYPGASKVIHLDFDGHAGDPAYDFDGNTGSFSDDELREIQWAWEQVSEDFLPFEVDVTTEDPGVEALQRTFAGDQYYGVRVVISAFTGDIGGWAYLWSFAWNYDQPCYVYTNGVGVGYKNVAEVSSHEAGHTLGLSHDGTSTTGYYGGHGSGATGWAPIMGVGYYQPFVQWSKGEYADANNGEDDLAIITTYWEFGYRPDDHGDSMATASPLAITDETAVFDEGLIERTNDVDFFVFETGAGRIHLDIDPFYRSPNLDILAQLFDDQGTLIASSNPTSQLYANLTVTVPDGTYYLSVEGIGKGTPSTGYSDYDSLGYYSIGGTVFPRPKASIAGRHIFYNNSAFDEDTSAPPLVLITEAGTGTPDYFEIQNFANRSVSTSGWVVAANNAGGNNINHVHVPLWSLPSSLDSGELRYRPDSGQDDIFWRSNDRGWLAIIDNKGAVVDFVVWGYDDQAIASMEIDVGLFANLHPSNSWIGPSVTALGQPFDALQRIGTSDNDDALDWTFENAPTGGIQNEGLAIEENPKPLPAVLVTEAGTGTPDYFEIQNVGDQTINTSGWVVAANNAGGNNINDVHAPLWTIPGPLGPGELRYRPDAGQDDIFWRVNDEGWVAIIDDRGTVIDFVVWGYDDQAIASMEIDVGAFANIRPGEAWSGPSVDAVGQPFDALQRVGNTDRNNASDWTFEDQPSAGTENPGLVFPFIQSPWTLDDNAVAPDKVALLPGEPASFANYSSYVRGINGIMIDIADLRDTVTNADLVLRVGNDADPGSWSPLAAAPDISVRPGAGIDGTSRVTIIIDDYLIRNQWLEVTVLATYNTSLPQPDVFFFGSSVAEVGNSVFDAKVDEVDVTETRNNPQPFFDPAPIDNRYDFNRDLRVNSLDTLIARNHQSQTAGTLKLLNHTSPVLITEADTGTPDGIRIQNIAAGTVTTTGWIVAANDASAGDINDVHQPLWELSGSMDPGEILYRPDTTEDDIFWLSSGVGWVMLLDDQGSVLDFVVWGYDANQLASFQVDVDNFTNIRVDSAWSGLPVSTVSAPSPVLRRVGPADHDDATDWTFDALAAKTLPSKNHASRAVPAKIEWLYEFGLPVRKDRQLSRGRPAALAVDRLLAIDSP